MDQTPYTGPRIDEAINVTSISLTANIVQAYCSHNAISRTDLPAFIAETHKAVVALYTPQAPAEPEAKLEPAVSIRKSITPDYVVCLECGEKGRSLKRHLGSKHNLTPEAYRAKWGLPADHVIVAPNYSTRRSELAKQNGLGRK